MWLGLLACLLPGALAARQPVRSHGRDAQLSEEIPLTSPEQLAKLSVGELDQVFCLGEAVPIPPGFARGRLLVLLDNSLPRISTRIGNLIWKGKHFCADGYFINQWLGFRALHSCAAFEPSWCDGQPCVVLQYPPGTPLLGNMRDEVRQIAPCLFLARAYQRCPRRLRGYIALQIESHDG
jgi:hypothetical protein